MHLYIVFILIHGTYSILITCFMPGLQNCLCDKRISRQTLYAVMDSVCDKIPFMFFYTKASPVSRLSTCLATLSNCLLVNRDGYRISCNLQFYLLQYIQVAHILFLSFTFFMLTWSRLCVQG